MVGSRIGNAADVRYVFQSLDQLPEGFSAPEGRTKPWGTGHAIYCCRNEVREPFAAINADDFYGRDAFDKTAAFLRSIADTEMYHFCMAGYRIENTLTDGGTVARGICRVSAESYLAEITERTRIGRKDGKIVFTVDDETFETISEGSLVSMNMWGFTPGMLNELEGLFKEFLHDLALDEKSAEFFLPSAVNALIESGKADVKVLDTSAKWYGMTYQSDKQTVTDAIAAMVRAGIYPERLWS